MADREAGRPGADRAEGCRPGGFFVTFEGGEGAGKSTQVARLKLRLEGEGQRVVTTREPGGSPRAEAIRDFLLAGSAKPFGPLAEAMLFAAARADHVALTISPALAAGAVVLCDRFADSTRVYQGMLDAVPAKTVLTLERLTVQGVAPDLTLVFDLPAELGLARADARRIQRRENADRFEREGLAFHEGVRSAFLEIAAAEPKRCVVVDALAPPDAVEQAIWRVLAERLRATRRAGGEPHGG